MQTAKILTTLVVGGVATLIMSLFWGPLSKVSERFFKDPEKGFKKLVIGGIALWVIVGIIMSIAVMLRFLGVIPVEKAL